MQGRWGKLRRNSVLLIAVSTALAGFALAGAFYPQSLRAAERRSDGDLISEAHNVHRIAITLNKSRTFTIEKPFATLIAGSPEIADVRALGDRTLYILGKKTGTTNVVLFDNQAKQIAILDVEVSIDVSGLRQSIRAAGFGAQGIRVSAMQSQVILSGVAADAVAAERAVSLAKGMVPQGGVVVNAMSVDEPQQVMLEVRFLEVNRTAGRDLGVNLYAANGNTTQTLNTGLGVGGSAGAITGLTRAGPTGIPLLGTASTLVNGAIPFSNLLTRVLSFNNGTTVDALITALETKGLVRELAEPNLIALSGESARFLAGGEFPVPVASTATAGAMPTVTIQFKTFGVELAFVPTVLARGVINIRLEPSVSELDFTNAVTIAGTTIPALTKRDARTTIELRDGQSFAIAGLLQTQNKQDVSQLPWIGSVPVLGALFRSNAYQQNETDLVVLVTPHLVAPVAPGQRLASPLDSRLPANDVDFFLNGQMEVRKRYTDYVNAGGDIKGPYGHIIAPEPPPAPAPAAVAQPVVKTLN